MKKNIADWYCARGVFELQAAANAVALASSRDSG
jgi:hypothetical protein